MKKNIVIFLLILSFLNNAISSEILINSLKEGKKLVFIRHANAPGNGDPKNFSIKNCFTQRNLNQLGIEQSKKIGLIFKNNEIKIDKVLSSEWCRCKDTAKLAFQNYETFDALNSFYDVKFSDNKNKQIKDLKNYIDNWTSKKNLILITHYVVILEILNEASLPGEIIVADKNLNVIGNLSINN
jgi:phosphohistidine phosphatase SixA